MVELAVETAVALGLGLAVGAVLLFLWAVRSIPASVPTCGRCGEPFPDGYFAINGAGRFCCPACSRVAHERSRP